MTILTIERGTLPQTHFQNVDDLARFMTQWNFERELDEGAERVSKKHISTFINI